MVYQIPGLGRRLAGVAYDYDLTKGVKLIMYMSDQVERRGKIKDPIFNQYVVSYWGQVYHDFDDHLW